MKRRIYVAVLALVMLMTCLLTGCQKLEEETGNADLVDTSGYACIKVYSIKEESTTDDAIKLVEEAINKITLKEYKTKIKLMLFTEDEYNDAIQEALDGLDELKAKATAEKAAARAESRRLAQLKKDDYEAYRKELLAKQKLEKEEAAKKKAEEDRLKAEAEAAGIEYIPEIEVPEYAIDVMLVRNVNELAQYKTDTMLKNLSEYVNLDYKSIAKHIHPTLLDMGRVGGALYGIVNNTYAGESQYVVFDTELYEKYSDKIIKLADLNSLKAFLNAVKTGEEGVIPLLNLPEAIPDGDYLTDATNPIGVYNPDADDSGVTLTVSNLFSLPAYQAHFSTVFDFRKSGFLPADDAEIGDDARFAVKFVSGDEYDKNALEEQGYTVFTFTKPRITNENCNVSFYGIYANTSYATRAMRFLELLTVNPELQTVFSYGIEGVHYEINHDGQIERLNDDYNIDLSYVGNRFIGKPTADENADIFEIAKERNQNVKVSALYGKDLDFSKEYLENFAVEKLTVNLQSAARATSSGGADFSYFVNGSYEADEYSEDYVSLLRTYCVDYAVSGGMFMVTAFDEEAGGYYVGNTARSKIDGVPTDFNAVVTPDMLPEALLTAMKRVEENDSDTIEYELVQDANDPEVSYIYSAQSIRSASTGKIVGLVCATTTIDDTVSKLQAILAEYWDDITTGKPDTSINRFADKVYASLVSVENRRDNLKDEIKNATDADEKKALQTRLDSFPTNLTTVKNSLYGISKDNSVVEAYANKILGYYASAKSGKITTDEFNAKVYDLLKDDFANMWNVWDEITSMNNRFNEETNITFLLEVLNKLYSK